MTTVGTFIGGETLEPPGLGDCLRAHAAALEKNPSRRHGLFEAIEQLRREGAEGRSGGRLENALTQPSGLTSSTGRAASLLAVFQFCPRQDPKVADRSWRRVSQQPTRKTNYT